MAPLKTPSFEIFLVTGTGGEVTSKVHDGEQQLRTLSNQHPRSQGTHADNTLLDTHQDGHEEMRTDDLMVGSSMRQRSWEGRAVQGASRAQGIAEQREHRSGQCLRSLDVSCVWWLMFIISTSGSLKWERRPSVLAEVLSAPANAPYRDSFLTFSMLSILWV